MGDLLTRLTSFVNFQKIGNVSVPGIILAFAMVLMYYALNPVGTFVSGEYPFDTSTIQSLDLPAPCKTLGEQNRSLRGGEGRLNKEDWAWLDKRRQFIEDCSQQARAKALAEQTNVAKLAAQIASEQKLATDFMKQYEDYALKGISLASRYRDLAMQNLALVERDAQATKSAESRLAAFNDLITRLAADQKVVMERLRAGEQEEPFADFVTKLISKITYLLLLGIVLGWALDPIMRQVQQLLYTPGRTYRMNLRDDGVDVPVGDARKPEDNLNYAIGVGLITNDDVEAFRNRYGYSSQFGLNLILPLAVLLIALGVSVDSCRESKRQAEARAAAAGSVMNVR